MKKGDLLEGIVSRVDYPGKGIVETPEGICVVKNVLPGQSVQLKITKKRRQKAEGTLQKVLEPSPAQREAPCPHFGSCGGCAYLNLSEEEEASLKCGQVLRLLEGSMRDAAALTGIPYEEIAPEHWFEGILDSPKKYSYRNKMEFTFGDSFKDGPLALGMHKRGSFYDIVTVDGCGLADPDFSLILRTVLAYFREKGRPYYHRMRHTGYLRHLLVRRAAFTGEILIDLVTTTQLQMDLAGFTERLLALEKKAGPEECPEKEKSPETNDYSEREKQIGLENSKDRKYLSGRIAGILHTSNDSLADIVEDHGTEILYGRDFFFEELLGLRFKVTPFSFFQTNSYGAQVLYETARRFLTENMCQEKAGIIYDLYCGTGTIAQLMAPYADKVIGVEIVEEAAEAARENAARNGLSNCEFIAGDVLKVLDEISEKPDTIILDPPRDGIHTKALPRILAYGVENILYISCKPTSLARDLPAFLAEGYRPVRAVCVNQFPWTTSVETVCLLSRH